ncbi:MAG: phage minor head protein [Pseudomonadota bacterium]
MGMKIVNYFEAAVDFELPPERAIEFFQNKGLRGSFAWQDMLGEEHDTAFTVAKMMDTDLLATVQAKLDRAIADGTTLEDFSKQLIPELQAAGWWGKRDVVDPETGRVVNAQLGSASRLETIFRSNMQAAYSVGQWDQIQESAVDAPYLLYDAVDDDRTRPEHAARDGEIHAVTSDFWKTHFPPNGWNCRCGVIQLTQEEARELGNIQPRARIPTREWTNPRTGRTRQVPADVDPGWDHNPGRARREALENTAQEKALTLTREQREANLRGLARRSALNAEYRQRVREMDLPEAPVSVLTNERKPDRVAWGNARDAALITSVDDMQGRPEYRGAKTGNTDDATDLVEILMSTSAADGKIGRQIRSTDPVVVPVHALEGLSYNYIPLAMAEYLASTRGLRVDSDIIQVNRVGHTRSSGYHRLATPPLFDGDVVVGEEYLLVDDFIGQGGTLANLRGYIQSNGGEVVGMIGLGGQRRSARLAISQETLSALRQKHGDLEDWWTGVFGYGFSALTEAEGRYLVRSPDADTIRTNLVAASRERGES